ncbi:MYND finger [Carpediemonas membranifera]|uniref:MYND finger n=1 Tax=Carpediemonas membranifera TaxID=201153 RepID=A0A8J6B840_9EUKA|nr:MYND finger [Carpediemonas membranifera]|eukprot:KAG9397578.1 MYND finger [Carpediemonas membranifera]
MLLNSLAAPKGVKYHCELCGKQATLMCPNCRTVCYCTEAHRDIDEVSIHKKICGLIQELQSEKEVFGSAQQRQQHQERMNMLRKRIVDIGVEQATAALSRQEYQRAIPAALQALKYQKELDSNDRSIVTPYLLLGEAHTGLGKLQRAEEFLSFAKWVLISCEETGESRSQAIIALRGRLHRQFGKLFLFQDRFGEAEAEFAADAYYSGLATGPESPEAAQCYFHMGNLFYLRKQRQVAFQFYDKIVEIWQSYLRDLVVAGTLTGHETPGFASETKEMFMKLETVYNQNCGQNHSSTGFLQLTIALFMCTLGQEHVSDALDRVGQAHDIFLQSFGQDHPATRDAANLRVALTQSQV